MEITITKKDNNHAEFIKAYLKLKCNFAKLYYKNEILRLEKEELEQQLGYECECNKQFVECQNLIEKILDIVKTNKISILDFLLLFITGMIVFIAPLFLLFVRF